MRKYLTTFASFVMMLCLGGVYAWSITAAELIELHGFSNTQTQLVFGAVIAVFPVTMIFVGKLSKRVRPQILTSVSAILFLIGYLLAGFSKGNFYIIFTGVGIISGIATGFGYLVSLTVPVKWFPGRKGLVTGIAAAGFGLGAILMSTVAELVIQSGRSIFELFIIVGITYGAIIFLAGTLVSQPAGLASAEPGFTPRFLSSMLFRKLFTGIFLGTFSGLLIIGSLKIIGGQNEISNHVLIMGVSLFAVSNFSGRLFWGYLSDYTGAAVNIFLALTLQALGIFLMGYLPLDDNLYLLFSVLTGFGFGGNFVLFAKETANVYGVPNLGIVYPYVFTGYAIAGIAGPLSGGLLFDYFGNFRFAVLLAAMISFGGGLLFLYNYFQNRVRNDAQNRQ